MAKRSSVKWRLNKHQNTEGIVAWLTAAIAIQKSNKARGKRVDLDLVAVCGSVGRAIMQEVNVEGMQTSVYINLRFCCSLRCEAVKGLLAVGIKANSGALQTNECPTQGKIDRPKRSSHQALDSSFAQLADESLISSSNPQT